LEHIKFGWNFRVPRNGTAIFKSAAFCHGAGANGGQTVASSMINRFC